MGLVVWRMHGRARLYVMELVRVERRRGGRGIGLESRALYTEGRKIQLGMMAKTRKNRSRSKSK